MYIYTHINVYPSIDAMKAESHIGEHVFGVLPVAYEPDASIQRGTYYDLANYT